MRARVQILFLNGPKFRLVLPHTATCSDVFEGYYIPKGMSYMCRLSVRRNELPSGAAVTVNAWYALCRLGEL